MPGRLMPVRMAMRLAGFCSVVIVTVMFIMHMFVLMVFSFVGVLKHNRVSARPGTGRDDRKQ